MIREDQCENCKCVFEYYECKGTKKRRFCSKKCWHAWNAENMKSFNEKRFQWKTANEEEKIQKLKENYEKHVVRKDGCWKWSGVKDKDGYGQLACGYHRQTKAHRVSWGLYKGEIPEGMKVCHQCDNPSCTNPDHLFLGTIKDNAKDMSNKLRGTNGTKNLHAKLNENDIPGIRKRLSDGESFYRIAHEFGVKPTTIWSIRENKSWRHVEENKCDRIERKTKLTEESVLRIRELLKMGVKSGRIAKDFNVSPSQICAINKGRSWKHVTPEGKNA